MSKNKLSIKEMIEEMKDHGVRCRYCNLGLVEILHISRVEPQQDGQNPWFVQIMPIPIIFSRKKSLIEQEYEIFVTNWAHRLVYSGKERIYL